jgi:hypothetical protein
MVAHVGYSVAGQSGGRVTLCVVCTVHVETRTVCFLVGSKQRWTLCQWFDLKTTGTVCQWFDLKTTGTVCQLFDHKTTRTVWAKHRWSVSWLSLKTKLVEGFSVWASKSITTV